MYQFYLNNILINNQSIRLSDLSDQLLQTMLYKLPLHSSNIAQVSINLIYNI